MVDPLPGPRGAADFSGLRQLATDVREVLASTKPRPPAGSSLPRLAAELPARLLLLDPADGTYGLAHQIAAAAAYFHLEEVALIDVGGDVLTTGADPGLRSPLADQLALAACVRTGIPTRLLVTGPGLDGELPLSTIHQRLDHLEAERLPSLTEVDVAAIRGVFAWHPSEASGLLAAAANGRRGLVEVRDTGDHVELTDDTTALFALEATRVAPHTPAAHLGDATSLAEAEQIVLERTGISEIAYETRKAARLHNRPAHVPTTSDLAAIDQHAADANHRGADFLSTRRLTELLGATSLDAYLALSKLLADERPDRYEPSLYRVNKQLSPR